MPRVRYIRRSCTGCTQPDQHPGLRYNAVTAVMGSIAGGQAPPDRSERSPGVRKHDEASTEWSE